MRDVGFAFNDKDFSDRILHLELVSASSLDLKSDFMVPDLDHDQAIEKEAKEEVEGKGDIAYDNNSECSSDVKLNTLHISSVVLASCSRFFYKLFKNGMKNSKSRVVNLRINTSEEAAFMDLLNYMYRNTLTATSAADLVDVLIVADKFEVTCCMSYCIDMLLKLPMTQESALLYLEIPSSVLVSEIVKPLIDAAKKYVGAHYKDFTKYRDEVMELPLSVVEAVLGTEGLQVISEDDLYNFILEWVRAHYPELEERRQILTERFVKLICFSNMSSSKLKEVLVCPDFEHEQVSKLVMEALFSKVDFSCGEHVHASIDLATTNYGFLGRVYRPRCVIYFDLKKEELKSLSLSKQIDSRPFCLGGKRLFLFARCCMEEQENYLGLFVDRVQGSETCTLDYEFAAMSKSSKEFQSKCNTKSKYFESHGWGIRDLLGIPWTEFMSDDNEYFIDGILHLRAELTLVNDSKP